MDKKEESRDVTLDASPRSFTRESLEEADATAGGCMEMDWTSVTAEESVEAEEDFLTEKIRRAEEWQEDLERAKAATRA